MRDPVLLREDLNLKVKELQSENEKLKSVLKEIATVDYRGNRSKESTLAYKALQELYGEDT